MIGNEEKAFEKEAVRNKIRWRAKHEMNPPTHRIPDVLQRDKPLTLISGVTGLNEEGKKKQMVCKYSVDRLYYRFTF